MSVSLSAPYLILNTSDGVLFPVGFFLQNNICYAERMRSGYLPLQCDSERDTYGY